MAVLEAFVYDPLLNWRLIDNKPKSKKSKTHGEVLRLRVPKKKHCFHKNLGGIVCCLQGWFNAFNWEQ